MGAANDSGIGNRLRAARERLGWSREELAFHSGVSWSAIAQAESGRRRNLRPRTLTRLSAPLGLSIDYLVNGGTAPMMLTHQALLYDSEDAFADGAGSFLVEGIDRSEAALALTSTGNLDLLKEHLGEDAGQVELLDSRKRMSSPEAVMDLVTDFLNARLEQGAVWVRIVAEPIWAGRSRSEVRVWTRFESMMNLLFAGSPMSVLCPYSTKALHPAILREAHATHPQTIDAGTVMDSPGYRGPGGFALEP